ncbi:MAG: glycerophosphodiester phosphodiesterase [Candidatus Sulfotelmatobacter sp.]
MPIRPLLLGHRGTRAEKSIPENTPAAFDLALAQGCDGFEFDARLSADGQAVICHDANAGGFEIAQCSARRLALPLLREILKGYKKSAFLDVELKVPGLERITLDLLGEHPPARGYVISSFLPAALAVIHGMDAAVPLGLICETQSQFDLWSQLPVQYVIPHHKLVRRSSVSEIKDAGRKLFVWTVNSTRDMRRFAEWGVDGIISDDPGRLALTLARQPTPRL